MKISLSNPRTLAIDIGGSGLKMLVLDSEGRPVNERLRHPTPKDPTPEIVIDELVLMTALQGEFERVSVGFPGVVVDGVTRTAVNLHPEWVGYDLASALEQRLQKPVRVANDADVQGLGAVEGKGVELMLTLGTGIGSALFVAGRLVPNLELGHHPFQKSKTYEERLGDAALKDKGEERWNGRLQQAIAILDEIFNYRVLYLGGGNAKKISFDLPSNVRRVANVAGLLGGIALWRD
jgi:polyphosphate glucokinase